MSQKSYTVNELARVVGGEVRGAGDVKITGVAGIRDAGAGEITFLADSRYAQFLAGTQASALIGASDTECDMPVIHLDNPYLAFLEIVTLFNGDPAQRYARGVHETAIIDPSAQLGENVTVGAYCSIGANSRIGDGSTVVFGCYIGDDVVIGCDCLIYPNVTVRENVSLGDRVIVHPGAVIGSDGFGFVQDGATRRRIPQVGKVVIEDDAEIGSNSTVDRATMGETRIGSGVKIDNLCQIGHNVVIGRNSALAAQSGISGSTELGEGVVMAGQSGVVGHIKLGDGSVVGAKSAVTKTTAPGSVVSGFLPARDHKQQMKLQVLTARLPMLFKKFRELEEKLARLEAVKGNEEGTEDD